MKNTPRKACDEYLAQALAGLPPEWRYNIPREEGRNGGDNDGNYGFALLHQGGLAPVEAHLTWDNAQFKLLLRTESPTEGDIVSKTEYPYMMGLSKRLARAINVFLAALTAERRELTSTEKRLVMRHAENKPNGGLKLYVLAKHSGMFSVPLSARRELISPHVKPDPVFLYGAFWRAHPSLYINLPDGVVLRNDDGGSVRYYVTSGGVLAPTTP